MSKFMEWLKNPLGTTSEEPSAMRLFLFVGLILVFIAAWAIIFSHIRENIE